MGLNRYAVSVCRINVSGKDQTVEIQVEAASVSDAVALVMFGRPTVGTFAESAVGVRALPSEDTSRADRLIPGDYFVHERSGIRFVLDLAKRQL